MADQNEILMRSIKECPNCGKPVSDSFIQQNPFPEFPCPSCGIVIDAASLKNMEIVNNDERAQERIDATLQVSYESYNEFIILSIEYSIYCRKQFLC